MTLDRSYIGYLGFLGIDLFKSVLMYSNGAICLIKLLFDLGLFTVQAGPKSNLGSTHKGGSAHWAESCEDMELSWNFYTVYGA